MIDWARVAELRDEIGPEDFGEIAELFLMEVEDTLSQLDEASSDPNRMQELMHFLKGSALNLGFSALSDLCGKGEGDASEGKISVSATEVKTLYANSKTAFESEFTSRFAA